MKTSPLYTANAESAAAVIVNQGGTSSGKTYSILQVLASKCLKEPGIVVTIAGQDIPNLKKGALRDMENIHKETPALVQEVEQFNRSDLFFRFRNGSVMEFTSYDGQQDAKSGKRDYLFVNEANGIPFNVYTELALRTRKQVFIDYNPNEEFWVHQNLIGQDGTQLIISDHRHNPFLSQGTRDKIEALKDQDIELWNVYARGRTGKVEGLIFRNYDIVEGLPVGAELIGTGLDFGFTNDPTACLQVYRYNGDLYIDELLYSQGLTNPEIATHLKAEGVTRADYLICDSAEPKSIQELRNEGLNAHPAEKGADSIKSSIDVLKRYRMLITRRSHGLRKELKSYKWKVTKDGTATNQPVDFLNHSIDALRYIALSKLGFKSRSGQYSYI